MQKNVKQTSKNLIVNSEILEFGEGQPPSCVGHHILSLISCKYNLICLNLSSLLKVMTIESFFVLNFDNSKSMINLCNVRTLLSNIH